MVKIKNWSALRVSDTDKERLSQPQMHKQNKKRHWILLLVLTLSMLINRATYADIGAAEAYWNIAIFGIDSRDGYRDEGVAAETQIIASINRKTGEIRIASVYGDTYTQINNEGDYDKINQAYFRGGADLALDTLERTLDLNIDDYVSFNWQTVANVINALDGIELKINDEEFRYINSYVTETVRSTGVPSSSITHAGMNHLDGVQAIAYSRLKLMGDNAFSQSERQHKVAFLMMEKAKKTDQETLLTVLDTVMPDISTSIGEKTMFSLIAKIKSYHLGQIIRFPFSKTTVDSGMGTGTCIIPITLETDVIALHQFLYNIEGYQPSAAVQQISAGIEERVTK